ncbi:hypothetical protein Fmac_027012 [Flemingia macrophylla]|uniref:DUF4220 domain-containing protein n=1 Tax=Flemingia macrophylla TaxID=520843 RepID=A0ABD1LGG4_9FABA
MVNPIPNFVKSIWSKWNIRIVILTSLWLQIILIFLATLRKRSRSNILVVVLWFAYLLADSTAIFCIGLISTKFEDEGGDKPILGVNDFLLAFWAPFLLLHLGGPDSITALAMEDNALWLRHLLGLIVQVCLTGYAFLLTLPENTLWLPTALVFTAGIIKFAEKIRSLQLASASSTLQSILRDPYREKFLSHVYDYEYRTEADNDVEVLPDETVVRNAYGYFNIFKCLVVDAMLGRREFDIREKFLWYRTAVDSLKIIEVELNLFYHAFYTKTSVICSKVGLSFRFLSVGSVVAALVLFTYDQKRRCNEFDVTVTYTLLYGAVALDIVSFLMLIFSDHSFTLFSSQNYISHYDRSIGAVIVSTFSGFLKLRMKPLWIEQTLTSPTWFKERRYKVLCRKISCCRWSESISGFSFISYACRLHQSKPWEWIYKVLNIVGAKEVVEQWRYVKSQPLLQKLWIFVFEELQRKSHHALVLEDTRRICSYRGEWVIREEGNFDEDDLNKLLPYVDSSNFTFDQCVIVWHIATDLLFYEAEDERQREKEDLKKRSDDEIETRNGVHDVRQKKNIGNDPDLEQGSDDGVVPEEDLRDVSERNKENVPDDKKYHDVELQHISKLLSDYMMYLFIMKPTMIPAMRGFGQKRFQETCDEAYECAVKRLIATNTSSKPYECILKLIKKVRNDICCWCRFYPVFFHDKKENDSEKSEEKDAFNKIRDAQRNEIIGRAPYYGRVPIGQCLLLDACDLADVIKNLKGTNKWKMKAQVLAELLPYTAYNSTPINHIQQLSKGGEFLSLVWLLMTHLGLAKQFQDERLSTAEVNEDDEFVSTG